MDRNTVIGFVLITLILIGWGYMTRPSKEQLEYQKQQRDSLQQVELLRKLEAELNQRAQIVETEIVANEDEVIEKELKLKEKFGIMSSYMSGDQDFHTLENEKVKMIFTNKGGKIYSVELKDYKTFDGKPLVLFDGPDNKFGFAFVHNTRNFQTNDVYFDVREKNDSSIIFELKSGNGEFLAFAYHLPEGPYLRGMNLGTTNNLSTR